MDFAPLKFNPGDRPPSAADLNAIIERLNWLLGIAAAGRSTLARMPNGPVIVTERGQELGSVDDPIQIGDFSEPPDPGDISGTPYEDITVTLDDNTAVEVYESLGKAYHHDGDQVLYDFKIRKLYDSRFNLREIGPLSIVEVDVPEECPSSDAEAMAFYAG